MECRKISLMESREKWLKEFQWQSMKDSREEFLMDSQKKNLEDPCQSSGRTPWKITKENPGRISERILQRIPKGMLEDIAESIPEKKNSRRKSYPPESPSVISAVCSSKTRCEMSRRFSSGILPGLSPVILPISQKLQNKFLQLYFSNGNLPELPFELHWNFLPKSNFKIRIY